MEELDDMGSQKVAVIGGHKKKSNGWVNVSGPLGVVLNLDACRSARSEVLDEWLV